MELHNLLGQPTLDPSQAQDDAMKKGRGFKLSHYRISRLSHAPGVRRQLDDKDAILNSKVFFLLF